MSDGQSATLEQELGGLLDQEWFEPPEDFKRDALITDLSEHEAAKKDPSGWWAKQAEALDWFQKWDTVLDDSDPPMYKWFEGGKINASYNCLDRHVENGLGDRVAFHWRGEEGEEKDVTYADLLRDVKKFSNALKDNGIEPSYIPTGGGSDANVFVQAGLPVVNLANGTERNHQPDESVTIEALETMLEVTVSLVRQAALVAAQTSLED